MKKITALILAVATLFLMAGCSFSLYRRNESQDVYKNFIDTETGQTESYAEAVAMKKSPVVVTVISNSIIRTARGSGSVTQIYSGVIINREGYVLTTSAAALLQTSEGNKVYSNKVMSAYAVLSEPYRDKNHYKLVLVGYDTEAGLALFRFYDRFHYYTDASRSEAVDGFQIAAEFSGLSVQTGQNCLAIGNSLGNALNAQASSPDRVDEIAQAVMAGVVSSASADNKALSPVSYGGTDYPYIMTTAPVNIDMYGGALFDVNGYLIGILGTKIGYESSANGESGYFKRVATAYPVPLLRAFIDTVAEANETPVPYTVAVTTNEETA